MITRRKSKQTGEGNVEDPSDNIMGSGDGIQLHFGDLNRDDDKEFSTGVIVIHVWHTTLISKSWSV